MTPIDFLKSRNLIPAHEKAETLSNRRVLDAARPLMPADIVRALTDIWGEPDPVKQMLGIHHAMESVYKRICEVMNALHIGRTRTPSFQPNKSFIDVERLLNQLHGVKPAFGIYIHFVRSYVGSVQGTDFDGAALLGFNCADYHHLNVGEVGARFIAAVDLVKDARIKYKIEKVAGLEAFVAQQLSRGTLSTKGAHVSAVAGKFVETRNASSHDASKEKDENWWSNDPGSIRHLLSYALPAFEAVLASNPILSTLTQFERITVPPTSAMVLEAGPVTRSICLEWQPIEHSALRTPYPIQFSRGSTECWARRDSTDPLVLHYIGPHQTWPSPAKGLDAIKTEHRNRCLAQIWQTGRIERSDSPSLGAEYKPLLDEVEAEVWKTLTTAFFDDVTTISDDLAEIIVGYTGAGAAKPDQTPHARLLETRPAALDRLKDLVATRVRERAGPLEDIRKRAEIADSTFVQRLLESLIGGDESPIVRRQVATVEIYEPRFVAATGSFAESANWLTSRFKTADTQPFEINELLTRVVKLLDTTGQLLVEAGQMPQSECKARIDELNNRYGEYVYSRRESVGLQVNGPTEGNLSDAQGIRFVVAGRSFQADSLVPFLHAFHQAFGEPGGPFLAALSSTGAIPVGPRKYLAHRIPRHGHGPDQKVGREFSYPVECGEGQGMYYFEAQYDALTALFCLGRFLKDNLGIRSEIVNNGTPVNMSESYAPSASADAELSLVFSRDGIDETVETSQGVPDFLRMLATRLEAREWLNFDRLPVPANRNKTLIAYAPFHADGTAFQRPLEFNGLFIETAWTSNEAVDVAATGLRHLEIDCTQAEDETPNEQSDSELYNTDKGYWKIAPDANGTAWGDWLSRGIATIGWPDLGDLADCANEYDFEERARSAGEAVRSRNDGVWQVWTFLRAVKVGDIVVANIGTHTVLGIGRVTESYAFDPELHVGPARSHHPHFVKVEWFDTKEREVKQMGWRKTLIRFNRESFESIAAAKPAPVRESKATSSVATFQPPPLDELLAMSAADAVRVGFALNDHLQSLFELPSRTVITRRLNAAHGSTQIRTLFKEFIKPVIAAVKPGADGEATIESPVSRSSHS
jgi:hypothetical protein